MTHCLIADEILGGTEPMPVRPVENEDGELILNDSCPNCGNGYDEIDEEYQICHYCKFDSSYEAALTRWRSTLLPFEDLEDILSRLPLEAWRPGLDELKRGVILELDIETETIWQSIMLTDSYAKWEDYEAEGEPERLPQFRYRKVLRIK